MMQKMKGLNLRRKVSQFKIVLIIKIFDILENLFIILLKWSFFRREAEKFSQPCLLRFTHVFNSRKCRKLPNFDFFKFAFTTTPRYNNSLENSLSCKIDVLGSDNIARARLRHVECITDHFDTQFEHVNP